jgi:hypothetical protein
VRKIKTESPSTGYFRSLSYRVLGYDTKDMENSEF